MSMAQLVHLHLGGLLQRVPLVSTLMTRTRERRQEEAMIRFYAQFIAPGDLCFDVGANMGNRTAVFVELGARVVAVEPQPACIAALKERFGTQARVMLVEAGLGEKEGTHEILLGSESTVSSMSREWVQKVQKSGRFGPTRWDSVIQVPITTLDALIARFGIPAFIKIDVEGFELQVLHGLTQPVRVISFEFTPENMDNVAAALRHLASLGPITTNYSLGESMELEWASWVGWEELVARLKNLEDTLTWGDVYVRW